MAKRWSVECSECGTKNTFNDAQDIKYAHWKVLAWIVPSGDPLVVCNECEYGKPKVNVEKKPEKKTKK
jgi:hypothetical protein